MIQQLADTLVLGSLLDLVRSKFGAFELVAHWKQGEFHHDVVVRIPNAKGQLPGEVLVVATNCNGGVKEVLCFAELPERYALWHWRCPKVADFSGDLPPVLARATTDHFFDPCDLLHPEARSELRDEFKIRQHGGGWEFSAAACGTPKHPKD